MYEKLLEEARKKGYDLGICGRIVSGGKVLLLQRTSSDNYAAVWEMPGGGVEIEEDPVEALVREIEEEAGLKVSNNQLQFVDFFEFHNIEKDKHKRKFCFQVQVEAPQVLLSHEHDDFKFFGKDDLEELKDSAAFPDTYNIWIDHFKLVKDYLIN